MSIDPNADTPLSQQAAEPVDHSPKSWSGPVAELQKADERHDTRLSALETGLGRLEQKTDAQTVILARLDKVAADPKVRAVVWGICLLFAAWLAKHGIEIKVPQ